PLLPHPPPHCCPLALHDALPISAGSVMANADRISPSSSGVSHFSLCASDPKTVRTSMLPVSGALQFIDSGPRSGDRPMISASGRSEEHTSELQSRFDLVCRLLLE